MHKEVNNIYIFGKLLPEQRVWKILLYISPATVHDTLMIIFVVYKAGNCSEHIETQYERTVQFPENYNRRSKYIRHQCRRYTQ